MKKVLLSIITSSLIILSYAQVPGYVPTSGLVGWWPFNGNANDESGNINNGTIDGATLTSDRFGNANNAYYFNGSAIISILNNSSLNIQSGNGMSVSIWAEKTDIIASGGLIGKRNGCAGNLFQYQIAFVIGDGGIGWGGMNGASDSYIDHNMLPLFPLNNWVNFIGTFDGSKWKIYQNAILMDSLVAPMQPEVTNDLLIGGSGSCQKFIGNLDDIGIWNRALTECEISALYNSGPLSSSLTPTICQGSSFTVGDSTYTTAGTYTNTFTAANGCDSVVTTTLAVLDCSGIENELLNQINLYPNPAKNIITVAIPEQLVHSAYTLLDNTGRIVLSGYLNDSNNLIDISSLAKGIYIIQIGEQRLSKKLLKE